MSKKKTTEEFLIEAKIKWNNFYSYPNLEYKSNKIHIAIECPNHGIFLQRPNDHLTGYGCRKCGIERTSISKTSNKKSFIEKSNKLYLNYYNYDKVIYNKSDINIIITCPKHGDFNKSPNSHLMGQGCPNCKISKGELGIKNFLDKKNIKYLYQHTFKDCKNKYVLKFDFYLPDYNMCIEYDGQQHYKCKEFWGGKKAFEYLKINDEIKNLYCKEKGITLYRIKYKHKGNIIYKTEKHLEKNFIKFFVN